MTPEALARLRAHVDALVAAARPPSRDVDDLVEEMLGHLVETVERTMATGAGEDEALRSAMTAFGAPDIVGRDLGRTYHSGLWAATIGVLLSPHGGARIQPGSIGGLRLVVAIAFALTLALGAMAVVNLTPLYALILGMSWGASLVSSALAFRGLGLGQRWALFAGLEVAAIAVVSGLLQVASGPAGTITIPLLGIGAGLVLVWAAGDANRIAAFVAGSRPIGVVLGIAVAGAILAPTVVSTAIPALHDPTQAGPSDVAMTISMTCRIGPDQPTGDPLLDAQPTATLDAEVAWSRADLLPQGLAGLVSDSTAGDTAGFRVLEPPPTPMEGGGKFPAWLLNDNDPVVIDAQSGEAVGWFGASSPSVERIPDTIGSFTVGINNDRIRAGHTTRIVWRLGQTRDGPPAWPTVEVAYAHLDRFVLIGRVGCGEQGAATADTEPAPAQPRLLP